MYLPLPLCAIVDQLSKLTFSLEVDLPCLGAQGWAITDPPSTFSLKVLPSSQGSHFQFISPIQTARKKRFVKVDLMFRARARPDLALTATAF